ncbi:MAG: hypothetical protein JWM57_946 [Phycisphaerales bacterium]|nr:hypothetical protein [Phycisphaerales bacterium]
MIETKFVSYEDESDLQALAEQGWMIYAVVGLSGLSAVYLRRFVPAM